MICTSWGGKGMRDSCGCVMERIDVFGDWYRKGVAI